MAQSLLDMILRTKKSGSGVKDTEGDLTGLQKAAQKAFSSWTEFNSALQVGGQVLDIAQKGIDATVGSFVSLADQVRESSATWGTSYEDSSRMIEAFGDMGIEAEALGSVFAIANQRGFTPSIDNLAGLADKALALKDPAERAALLAENLGRGWKDVWPVLAQGGDAFREMTGSVSEAKIISEEAAAQALEYKLALDDLKGAAEDAGLSIGKTLLPVLTDFLIGLGSEEDVVGAFTEDFWKQEAAVSSTAESYDVYREAMEKTRRSAGRHTDPKEWDLYNEKIHIATEAEWEASRAAEEWIKQGDLTYDARDRLAQITKEDTTAVDANTEAQQRNKDALGLIKQSFSDLTAEMIYNAAAAELDSAQALDLARDMGLLNEDTYASLTTIDSLNQELADGTINASEYNLEILKLQGNMDALNGKTVKAEVFVALNGPGASYAAAIGAASGADVYVTDGGKVGKAGGGPVYAGGSYWVGEKGPEPFVPAVNGTILSREDAMKALRGGVSIGNVFFSPMPGRSGQQSYSDFLKYVEDLSRRQGNAGAQFTGG